MCRWLAYSGSPVRLEELLYKPQNSLIIQSLHSRLGAEATNGDGVGVGWYGDTEIPGLFRSTEPAWSDRNLRDLAAHIDSRLVLAHIRASIGSPVQQTNCHPFRHGRWLWMHNGYLDGFGAMKRDLVLAVDPELFPAIEGSTDSELFFYLALTFGLAEDPPAAVARAVGCIEKTAEQHGVAFPVQMTVATTDGETHLGVPVLQRRPVALAVPQHRRVDTAPPVPRQPGVAWTLRRRPSRGVRAAGRPPGRVARGAGVHVRDDHRRYRPAAAVPAGVGPDRAQAPGRCTWM